MKRVLYALANLLGGVVLLLLLLDLTRPLAPIFVLLGLAVKEPVSSGQSFGGATVRVVVPSPPGRTCTRGARVRNG
jgi:hypothetical protein